MALGTKMSIIPGGTIEFVTKGMQSIRIEINSCLGFGQNSVRLFERVLVPVELL